MTTPNPGENRASEATWIVYSREHNLWWRTNRSGYAPCIEEAGRYTRAEAERICRDAGTGRGDRSEFDEGPPEFCVPDPTHTAALTAELARVKARCGVLEEAVLHALGCDHSCVKSCKSVLRDAIRAADPKPAKNRRRDMSTHTPGPWGFRKHIFPATKDTYRLSCQEAWYLHGAENDSDFLADCFFKKDEHASSDIRLIAAAPDLLDVAMFFADCLQERSAKDRDTAAFRARWNIPIEVSLDEFSRSMVAAAIAKATKPAPGAKP